MKISILPNFKKSLYKIRIVLYNVDDKNEKGCQREELRCSALIGTEGEKLCKSLTSEFGRSALSAR